MGNEKQLPPEVVESVLALGGLALAFGRVNRRTYHEDGVTPESDTDHTVMLGLVALAYADRYAPRLDKGLIGQYAFAHDLVEVYAGDTPTLHIQTEDAQAAKKEREDAALARLHAEFDAVFPWIARTIEEYESLATPEARFVKFIDKILPKITHILNEGKVMQEEGFDREKTRAKLEHQFESIAQSYGADQPEVRALYAALTSEVYRRIFGEA